MVFSPYLAAYTNENFNVFIGSMGIRMGRNWMIAFLFSDNNTGQNYPLDPLAIPDEIYYEGLSRDSFMIFKNSYTGIQAFWSGNNIFIYSALLQNYGEFSGEHLVLLLRLSWHINF
jgi:hypothetical protein